MSFLYCFAIAYLVYFNLAYTISSVTLFLYQLFVSIRKGFITRSLGLKRSQEYSYAQQAAGTSGFFYFAGNCIYFENEHKRHSLFLLYRKVLKSENIGYNE